MPTGPYLPGRPRRAALGASLVLALSPALAEASEADTRYWTLGAQARAGAAITVQPNDQPGDVTLLYGSGFQGPGFGFAGVARCRLHPAVALQFELGVGSYRLTGWAARDDERRELTLEHVSIELGALVQGSMLLGSIELFAGLGVTPRVGTTADITDTYRGSTPPDAAPVAATAVAFPIAAELGFAWTGNRVRLPVSVRGMWNASYPDRTIDRLSDWRSFDDRGRYAVEHDFDVLAVVGVDLPLR